MKQILFETSNLAVRSETGSTAEHLYLRFSAGETAALLGERDSGRLAFFDYLCSRRVIASSGNAWGAHHEDACEYLKRNRFVVSDESFVQSKGNTGISIIENLYLARPGGCGEFLWEPERYEDDCWKLLETLELDRDPSEDIGGLTRLEHLKLQIGKGLLLGAKIIAVEEDFEGFSPSEIDQFAIVAGKLKLNHDICFIWSTNGLHAVSELADRVIVFSGGTAVKQFRTEEEMTAGEIEAIIHRAYRPAPHSQITETGEPVFTAENLELSRIPFRLSLQKGEVISIVEYSNENKSRLYQILSGLQEGKDLYLEGKRLPKNWYYAKERYPIIGIDTFGIKGMFANLSPAENLFLPSMRKASRPGLVVPAAGYQAVWADWKKRHPDSGDTIESMNRGDRLSLQLESWLIFNPRVLILLEPFLHLDQQGRDIFREYFTQFRNRGTGIIVLTSSRTNYLGDDAKQLESDLFDRIIYTENGAVIDEQR